MKHIIRPLSPLFAGLVISMLGIGFYMTFASLRVSSEGSSNIMVGFINSSYYAGMMIGSLVIERIIERIGHIRSFALSASLNIVAVLLQMELTSAWWWLLFRFCIGLCCASYFIVIESWLLLGSTTQTRGKVLSLYMLFLYAGQGLGQFILNLTSVSSNLPFVITSLLTAVAMWPIMMIKGSGPVHVETVPVKIPYLIKKAPLGVLGCFLAGLILSSFYALGPIFGKDVGMDKSQISMLMGLTIIGGLFLQWPMGHLSDIFDRPKVLVGICALLGVVCCTLFFFQTAHFGVVLGLTILFGGLSFTLYPICISYTCDHFSPYLIIKITCSLLIIYGTGCIFGPVLAAYIMRLTDPGGLFLYCATLSTLLMSIAIFRIVTGKSISQEEQGDYMPLPRTTSLVNYLYPRGKGIDFEIDLDDDEED